MEYCTHSQGCINLDMPYMNAEQGENTFTYYVPHWFDRLQDSLKFDIFLPLKQSKTLLTDVLYNDLCFI